MFESPTAIIRIFANIGEFFSRTTQRWFPDSWVVCMILTTVVIFLAIFGVGAGIEETVLAWGNGMWALLEIGM